MSSLPTLRDILNNTPANAIDVDWNFDTLVAFVAQELINRDGSVAMAQPLTLGGPAPSAPNHAATKAYVDQSMPLGVMVPFAGPTAPAGWALCDGASKSTTDPAYAGLFAVIQYAYGGAGANFNLPDMRGRMPIGKGAAHTPTLGVTGGRTDTPVIAHTHTINHGHSASSSVVDLNHQHAVNHGHGSITTTQDGQHQHQTTDPGYPVWANYGPGSLGMNTAGTGHAGAPSNLYAPAVTSPSGNHVHQVNIPVTLLNTDWMDRSNAHGHGVTVDAVVASSGSTGEAVGTQNLPPFQVVNYIIRIGV